MKKIIVGISLLFIFIVGHPTRADAETTDRVTSKTAVTFIANPNLPKPSAPGLPSEGSSGEGTPPQECLPKTGEVKKDLLPVGLIFLLLAIVLFLKKKRAD